MDDDFYGPALPPGYVKPEDSDDSQDQSDNHATEKEQTKIIGPQIPAFFKGRDDEDSSSQKQDSDNAMVPSLPFSSQAESDSMSSEENSYGPMPTKAQDAEDVDDIKSAIEKRAKKMKDQLDNRNIPVVKAIEREEWMTVPDTSRRNQLSAISHCLAPPKPSSAKEQRPRHSEKDKRTSEELKKYNKSKRSESLLELHKKDRKKKAKDKDKNARKERKAFDRDEIAVRQFTTDQVNTVVDKAKYLNSRFNAGNQKFL